MILFLAILWSLTGLSFYVYLLRGEGFLHEFVLGFSATLYPRRSSSSLSGIDALGFSLMGPLALYPCLYLFTMAVAALPASIWHAIRFHYVIISSRGDVEEEIKGMKLLAEGSRHAITKYRNLL